MLFLSKNINLFKIVFQAALNTLGVQVYEICRPNYPGVLDVMSQIPNINASDLQKLDEKISVKSNLTKGNKIDKIKKDLFKKLTVQVSHSFFF